VQLRLGPNGVEEVLPLPALTPYEQSILDELIPDLVAHAKRGVDFFQNASSDKKAQ
jgi:hypothetical protein